MKFKTTKIFIPKMFWSIYKKFAPTKISCYSVSNSMLMNATADHDRQGQAAHRQYRQLKACIMTLKSVSDSVHDV